MHRTLALLALVGCGPTQATLGAPDRLADPPAETTAELVENGAEAPGAEPIFVLSNPAVAEAEPDGVWRAGEVLTLTMDMSNVSSEDFMAYPGAFLVSDHEAVDTGMEWWFYGMFAGQTEAIAFQAVPSVDLPAGTVVRFTADVDALGCDEPDAWTACPPSAPLVFDVVVGE